MTTVYLHIGFPKTGTSAIQNFFRKNSGELRRNKVLYPDSGLTDYAGQAGLAFAAKKKAKRPFDILKKEVTDSQCEKCVISSEYFFMLEPKKVAFLADQMKCFDMKIVVYLRRQDERIESGYLQVLRDSNFRFNGDIEAYIKFLNNHPRRTDYYEFLKPWVKSFGKSNIFIKLYGEEKGPDKLVPGFLKVCNIPNLHLFVPDTENVNLAFKPIVNSLLQKINKVPMSPHIHLKIVECFNFISKHVIGYGNVKSHKLLAEARREQIIEQYKNSNSKVAKEYLNKDNGLFE